ncbi:MAG: FtsK/SpoIIIE domain-containing protein, partial [bacterium]
MSDYTMPDYTGFLRYHTRWKRRNLGPYVEEFFELLSENGIRYRKISRLQGPSMTRFIVIPKSVEDARKLCTLRSYCRVIFEQKNAAVYPHNGRVYVDIPWQNDAVWLGDLLVSDAYNASRGLPCAAGLSLKRERVFVDLTDVSAPHLMVCASKSSEAETFLHGAVLSLLLNHTPSDVSLWLCGGSNVSFSQYGPLKNVRLFSDDAAIRSALAEALDTVYKRLDILSAAGCDSVYDYKGSMDHIILVISDGDALFAHRRRELSRVLSDILSFGPEAGIHMVLACAHPACAEDVIDFFQAAACFRTPRKEDSVFLLGSDLAYRLRSR